MPDSQIKQSQSTVNWFFWIVIVLIALYYFNHFFIFSNKKEQYLYNAGTSEIASMIESIKAQEDYYSNMLASWQGKDLCTSFQGFLNNGVECSETGMLKYWQTETKDLPEERFHYKDNKIYLEFRRFKSEDQYGDNDYFRIYVPIDNLFEGLLGPESNFDGYSISYYYKQPLLTEEKNQSKPKVRHLYSTAPFDDLNQNTFFDLDSLSAFAWAGNGIIGGRSHKVFSSTFSVQNVSFGIIGFVDSEKWREEISEFNFIWTVNYGAMVLILILLIPHLRILNLNFTDRLGYKHIVRLFISLMLIIPIIIVVLWVQFDFGRLKSQQKKKLTESHQEVYSYLKRRLPDFDNTLHKIRSNYGELERNKNEVEKLALEGGLQELFELNSNGIMSKMMVFNQSLPSNTLKDAFEDHNSLAYRDYYKEATDSKVTFEIVKSVTSDNPFEFNFSLREGNSIVVANTAFKRDSLMGIVSDPESIFFHLIDQNGSVLFDSRKGSSSSIEGNVFNRFSSSSILTKEKLRSVEEDLEVFKTFYEGDRVTAKLTKFNIDSNILGKEVKAINNYYLVTFHSFALQDSYQASYILMTSIIGLGIFFVVMLLWLLLKIVSKQPSSLLRNRFSLPWLLPKNKRTSVYYFTSLLTAVVFVVQIFLCYNYSLLTVILGHLTSVILLTLICYFLLSSRSHFIFKTGWIAQLKTKVDRKFEFRLDNSKKAHHNIYYKRKFAFGLFLTLWLSVFTLSPTWSVLKKVQENELSIFSNNAHSESIHWYTELRSNFDSFSFIQSSHINSITSHLDNQGSNPSGKSDIHISREDYLSKDAAKEARVMGWSVLAILICLFFYQRLVLGRMFFRTSFFYGSRPMFPLIEELKTVKLNGGFIEINGFKERNETRQWKSLEEKADRIRDFIELEVESIKSLTNRDQRKVLDIIQVHSRIWNNEIEELTIYKLQGLMENYYMNEWNRCDSLDKLLLYDLAEDGCLNATNRRRISGLIERGLIKFDDESLRGPEIMNKSFQNFILTHAASDEELQEQLTISNKGKWSTSRTIILAVALLLLFVSFTLHENVIEKFTAILTGAIAFIPTVFSGLSGLKFPSFKTG